MSLKSELRGVGGFLTLFPMGEGVLPKLYEIFYNVNIQKRKTVANIICRNTVPCNIENLIFNDSFSVFFYWWFFPLFTNKENVIYFLSDWNFGKYCSCMWLLSLFRTFVARKKTKIGLFGPLIFSGTSIISKDFLNPPVSSDFYGGRMTRSEINITEINLLKNS